MDGKISDEEMSSYRSVLSLVQSFWSGSFGGYLMCDLSVSGVKIYLFLFTKYGFVICPIRRNTKLHESRSRVIFKGTINNEKFYL